MKFANMSMVLLAAILFFIVSTSFASAAEGDTEKLNVNSATVEQLSAVPGITPEIAQKIVEYRDDMGDITNIDELKDVEGLTPEIFDKIKDLIGVEGIEGSDCTC